MMPSASHVGAHEESYYGVQNGKINVVNGKQHALAKLLCGFLWNLQALFHLARGNELGSKCHKVNDEADQRHIKRLCLMCLGVSWS